MNRLLFIIAIRCFYSELLCCLNLSVFYPPNYPDIPRVSLHIYFILFIAFFIGLIPN